MSLPRVTDHALVRYLERARGFDVEDIRRHIAKLCAGAVAAGAGTLHAEGVKFELGTGLVITVSPHGKMPCKTRVGRLADRVRG